MKRLLFFTLFSVLLSCNDQNSEIQKISNSIKENTRRANEMSKPLFSADSLKREYKFKRDSTPDQPIDSILVQVMKQSNEYSKSK